MKKGSYAPGTSADLKGGTETGKKKGNRNKGKEQGSILMAWMECGSCWCAVMKSMPWNFLGGGQGVLRNASRRYADSRQGVAHSTLGRRELYGQGIVTLVSATTEVFDQGGKRATK